MMMAARLADLRGVARALAVALFFWATTAASDALNPIQQENLLAGSTGWNLSGPIADDSNVQIKGYTDQPSVAHGEPLIFRVSSGAPPRSFDVQIYRMGWYGGLGGRLVSSLTSIAGSIQPPCSVYSDTQTNLSTVTGRIECHWTPSFSITIPSNWTTGIYLAKLTRSDGYQTRIPFAVRDEGRAADFLYQQPVTTYQAYNNFPRGGSPSIGKSFYRSNSDGPTTILGTDAAVEVSFDRPYKDDGASDYFAFEHDALVWLEREGYDISYTTNLDLHRNPERALAFKALISGGHDEYWTRSNYDAFERARDAGVHLFFLGSNAAFGQVRLEASSGGTQDRTLVYYRTSGLDPEPDPALETIQWRFLGRAEQELYGIQYKTCCAVDASGENLYSDWRPVNLGHWAFSGTGFTIGSRVLDILGYEIDQHFVDYARPPRNDYQFLASSIYERPFETEPDEPSQSVLFTTPAGSQVFATGTLRWGQALMGRVGDDPATPLDETEALAQLTKNILDRMTRPPGPPSPFPGLVSAWAIEETSWGRMVPDHWIYGFDAAVRGPIAPTQEPSPGCTHADFDGASNYLEVEYEAPLNPKAFTVSIWARVDGGSGAYRSPLSSRWGSSIDGVRAGYNLYVTPSNRWEFWTGRTGGWDVVTGPTVSPGAWTHVAAVFEPAPGPQVGRDIQGTKRLYVNGRPVASEPGVYRPNTENPLLIGAGQGAGATFHFEGGIDQVRVYNLALGGSSIAALAEDRCECGLGTGTGPAEICQTVPEPAFSLAIAIASLQALGLARRRSKR